MLPRHAVHAGHTDTAPATLRDPLLLHAKPCSQVTFAADSGSHYPPLSPEKMSQPLLHLSQLGNVHLSNTAHQIICLKKTKPKQTQSTTSLFVFVFLGFLVWVWGFFSPSLFLCLQVQSCASHPCSGLKCSGCSCLSHPLEETRPCSEGRRWDASPCFSHPTPH